jgi:NADPH:quinone reductase
MDTLNGAYAEYAVCPQQTVFHIPDSMSFEEAATIPLVIFTAAVGLYRNLDMPAPWDRSDDKAAETEKVPLVVNAASGAVGAFAIKLAKLNARIGPIIAIAGASADYVRTLGVDAIVDYRSNTVAEDIRKAANGVKIRHVFDAANTLSSTKYLTAVLERGGKYTCTTPVGASKVTGSDGEMERILQAAGVHYEQIWCGDVYETKKPGGIVFGAAMSRAIEYALASGQLSGHPYEVTEHGLDGVLDVLLTLKDRAMKKSGNAKFVARIADTPSLKG